MAAPDKFKNGSFLVCHSGSQALIYFDCVLSETVTRDADITEFPVEVGANISDHYRLKLTSVKLEVFVSQEPITEDPLVHPEGGGFWGAQALDFAAHPYPKAKLDVATVGKAIVNPVGSLVSAISGALSGDPRKATMETLQFAAFDSLESLLGALDSVREAASLVDIHTKSQLYDGFAIGEVVTSRDKDTGTGTKVSIAFHRILQVQTGTVAAPPAPKKAKDKPPVNKGAQQPTDPGDKESFAHGLIPAPGA